MGAKMPQPCPAGPSLSRLLRLRQGNAGAARLGDLASSQAARWSRVASGSSSHQPGPGSSARPGTSLAVRWQARFCRRVLNSAILASCHSPVIRIVDDSGAIASVVFLTLMLLAGVAGFILGRTF